MNPKRPTPPPCRINIEGSMITFSATQKAEEAWKNLSWYKKLLHSWGFDCGFNKYNHYRNGEIKK